MTSIKMSDVTDNQEGLGVKNSVNNDSELVGEERSDGNSVQNALSDLYSKPNMTSKKELKRQQRREAYKESKKEQKLKKKLQKRQRRELAGDSDGKQGDEVPNEKEGDEAKDGERDCSGSITQRKRIRKEDFATVCANNFHVIVDCSWEDFHTDSTLKSLTQQIMFCYGFNRRHDKPVTLHLSSLGPRSVANLQKVSYENWAGLSTSPRDYLLSDQYSVAPSPGKKQLVFLTSDSPNILDKVEEDCAYIIGGIVDRNVYKGATYKKASDVGLRTARLPLREHVTLSASPVLTVNHVFEILLRYASVGDWKVAIEQTLPLRKGEGAPKSRRQRRNGQRSSDNKDYTDGSEEVGDAEEGEEEGDEEADEEKS
ncbi:hypothetical protein EON65_19170 [archaeon]|nr:MAG: hypothetical protein EON65_19170 [archaeon]